MKIKNKRRNWIMKKCFIVFASICLLVISAYADYECDDKYHSRIKKIRSISGTEMSKEDRNRYIAELQKAYQLCKEVKKQDATEIIDK
jgi:hypothetical protein